MDKEYGYLQNKIREQNEKIIELNGKIKTLENKFLYIEKMPLNDIIRKIDLITKKLDETNIDIIDKKIHQLINSFAPKIEKINRKTNSEIIKNINIIFGELTEYAQKNFAYAMALLERFMTFFDIIGNESSINKETIEQHKKKFINSFLEDCKKFENIIKHIVITPKISATDYNQKTIMDILTKRDDE